MALPATDNFTAADGTDLAAYSANWTEVYGAFVINSNAVSPNNAGDTCMAIWNADTFSNDQYSQIVIAGTTSVYPIGTCVRGSLANFSCYTLWLTDTQRQVRRFDNHVDTVISQDSVAPVIGETYRISILGSSITVSVNGVLIPALSATDTTYTSGRPGLVSYSNQTGYRMDTWQAGNVGSPIDFGRISVMPGRTADTYLFN